MNGSLVPSAIEGLVGVTSIAVSTAEVTVSVLDPLTRLAGSVAVTVVAPTETLVPRPWLPGALLTVATVSSEELHVTESVRSCVESSLYVPIAVNCCVVPSAMDGSVGVTSSEVSTAAVTVSVVEPPRLLPGSVAVMLVTPTETLVARPSLPGALLTVATVSSEELHVTALVRSWVELSLKVPIAVNGCVVPSAIDGSVGVTSIEVRTAAVTVSVVEPPRLVALSVAVRVEAPIETLVVRPSASTVATPESEEVHATELVKSCVESLVDPHRREWLRRTERASRDRSSH